MAGDFDHLSDDYLSGRETVPAVVSDALREGAYLAGMKFGWNCGIHEDLERYHASTRSREGHLAAFAEYKRRLVEGGDDGKA